MRTYTTPFGTFTIDETRDVKMARSFEHEGAHQRADLDLLLPFVSSDMAVVDVGAHIGTFSVPFSRHARKVYAIEPMPETFAFLERNVRDNQADNIVLFNCGVAEKSMVLHAEETPNRAGTMFFAKGAGREVEAKPLSDIIPADERIGLVKIDVEGMELSVLRSASALVDAHRPVIFLEVNTPALSRHGISRAALAAYFRAKDYVLFRPTPDGKLARILSLYQGTFFDCVAVPRERADISHVSALSFLHGQASRKATRLLRRYGIR